MVNYGKAIKTIRTLRKLQQAVLAKKLGVTVSHLSKVENARVTPSNSLLERIASCLEVPLEVLLWHSIEPPENMSVSDREMFEVGRNLANRYLALAPKTTHS